MGQPAGQPMGQHTHNIIDRVDRVDHPAIAPKTSSGKHRPYDRAVVLGGSMTGLLMARVLATRFAQVIVVERDTLPSQPVGRSGLPQGKHVHVLLARGQAILEELFPGFEAELTAAGAPAVDWTADCQMMGWGGWNPRFTSQLVTRTCSRDLLDWLVRSRVRSLPNVQIWTGCQVVNLLGSGAQGHHPAHVTGVQLQWQGERLDLTADLVIDATGRSSRAPEWLAQLGSDRPAETVVDARLGYATRWYRLPQHHQETWKSLLIWAKPPHHPRAGVLYPVEGDRWAVTVSGVGGDYPPADPEGFLAFVQSLRDPAIYNAIRDAEPVSEICIHRGTANRLRHYERLRRFPLGLLVAGDAACAFNPIYGQGMTAAALAAVTLERCLERHECQESQTWNAIALSHTFRQQLARAVRTPWMLATGEDLRWIPRTTQRRDLVGQALQHYFNQVLHLTAAHPDIHEAVWRIQHMMASPSAVLHPAIVRRVLTRMLGQAWGCPPPQPGLSTMG